MEVNSGGELQKIMEYTYAYIDELTSEEDGIEYTYIRNKYIRNTYKYTDSPARKIV